MNMRSVKRNGWCRGLAGLLAIVVSSSVHAGMVYTALDDGAWALFYRADMTRDAVRILMDCNVGVLAEARHKTLPTYDMQTMFNVGTDFLGAKRIQMTGGDHALAELLHAGILQRKAKFLLSQQKALQ